MANFESRKNDPSQAYVKLDGEDVVEVPNFDLDNLRQCCSLTEIAHWEPGRRLHWRRKPLTAGDWQTLVRVGGLLGAIFGGVVVGLVGIPDLSNVVSGVIGAIVGAIVVVGLICLLLPFAYPSLNVEVDFLQRVVHWRAGRKARDAHLTDISQFVLRGIIETYTSKIHQGTKRAYHEPRPAYRCALDLMDERGQITLIESERLHKADRKSAIRDMAPLAVLLSHELGLTWTFQDFTHEKEPFLERVFKTS